MTKMELLAKKRQNAEEAKTLIDKVNAESRDLTDVENKRLETLMSHNDSIDRQVLMLEKCESAEASTRVTPAATEQPVVTAVRERVEDDPNFGFKNPAQFLHDVMQHGMGRKPVNAKGLLRLRSAVASDEQDARNDNYGGFLVPSVWTPTLLTTPTEADPTQGRTRAIPMGAPAIAMPYRVDKDHSSSVSGGLTVSRRAETAAASASRQQYKKLELRAFSLFGLSYVTEELLSDSAISFAALIAGSFGDEFQSHMLDEKLNGTGVGEHLGVMKSPALITIAKETGQAADTLVYNNVIKMRARCFQYQNAIWLANHDVLPQLILLNQTIGTAGVPVWMPSARDGEPDRLLGRPIFFSEYLKTVGDLGDVLLGNFAEYLEGSYQPMQSAESVHVRFEYHERTFKFFLRNAGAPWWDTVLTPKNGATLSPFVTLAARA